MNDPRISTQQLQTWMHHERTSLLTAIQQLVLEKMVWRRQALNQVGEGEKSIQDRLSALIADMHTTSAPSNLTTPAHIILYHDYQHILNAYNTLLEQHRHLQTQVTEQTERIEVAELSLRDRDTRLTHITTLYTQRSQEVTSLREQITSLQQQQQHMMNTWEHAKKEMGVRYAGEMAEVKEKNVREMEALKEEIKRLHEQITSSQSVASIAISSPSASPSPPSPSSPIHSPSSSPPPPFTSLPPSSTLTTPTTTIRDIVTHRTQSLTVDASILSPITSPSSPLVMTPIVSGSTSPRENGVMEDTTEGLNTSSSTPITSPSPSHVTFS